MAKPTDHPKVDRSGERGRKNEHLDALLDRLSNEQLEQCADEEHVVRWDSTQSPAARYGCVVDGPIRATPEQLRNLTAGELFDLPTSALELRNQPKRGPKKKRNQDEYDVEMPPPPGKLGDLLRDAPAEFIRSRAEWGEYERRAAAHKSGGKHPGGRPKKRVPLDLKKLDEIRGRHSWPAFADFCLLSVDTFERARKTGSATQTLLRAVCRYAKSKGIRATPKDLIKKPTAITART